MQASSISSSPNDGPVAAPAAVVPLLELPDPCLLAVMRCCAAADTRTLFSAAHAHSRLRQAALVALSSIHADIRQKHQLSSLRLYLSKHGQHVHSISLKGDTDPGRFWMVTYGWTMIDDQVTMLRELPVNLPSLHTVTLTEFCLQLQPGRGHRGVLSEAVGAHLKRLELFECVLLDGAEGLAAALAQLPGLEQLTISNTFDSNGERLDRTSLAI